VSSKTFDFLRIVAIFAMAAPEFKKEPFAVNQTTEAAKANGADEAACSPTNTHEDNFSHDAYSVRDQKPLQLG
jgi:hypothetical protein